MLKQERRRYNTCMLLDIYSRNSIKEYMLVSGSTSVSTNCRTFVLFYFVQTHRFYYIVNKHNSIGVMIKKFYSNQHLHQYEFLCNFYFREFDLNKLYQCNSSIVASLYHHWFIQQILCGGYRNPHCFLSQLNLHLYSIHCIGYYHCGHFRRHC